MVRRTARRSETPLTGYASMATRKSAAKPKEQLGAHPAPTDASAPVIVHQVAEEHRPPTREEVQVRAYFVWRESGDAGSDPLENWLKAERELQDRHGRSATAP